MLTIFAVLIVFGVLILVHELGHMLMAKGMGVRVERFSLGMGKKLFGIKRGGTEYIVSAFPLGGYVKMAGDELGEQKGAPYEFYSKGLLARFSIILAGPLANYVFALLLFISVAIIGKPVQTTEVAQILPDYPAQVSGLKAGDMIVEIDRKKVASWDELVDVVRKKTDKEEVDFKIERDGKVKRIKITPKIIKVKGEKGEDASIGIIGIRPKLVILPRDYGIFEAVTIGGKNLIITTMNLYRGLWLIARGAIPVKQALGGPLEIGFTIGEALKMGFFYLLSLMAMINVMLVVVNLLPVPILDGGHILFLALEKLRGKPVSRRAQEVATQIAFYALITLVVLVTWNDCSRHWPDIAGRFSSLKK